MAYAKPDRRLVRCIHCRRKREYPSDTQKRSAARRACLPPHPLPRRQHRRTIQPRNGCGIGISPKIREHRGIQTMDRRTSDDTRYRLEDADGKRRGEELKLF